MFKKIRKVWKDPLCMLRWIMAHNDFSWIPDTPYLKIMYYAHLGKKLNLKNPTSCSEKMQWLKLYDQNPRYTDMVDKQEAKRIITEILGEGFVIPTIGIWDDPDQIDFDALPDRFVLKTTHDSGSLLICKDKTALDLSAAKEKMRESLKREYFYWGREWPYKNVKPRIIAEVYMEDTKTGELRDYKWYCFHGVPKMMAIFCGRSVGATTATYFDDNFQQLHFTWGYSAGKDMLEKPCSFEQMKRLASALSKDIPCLRVDFYEVDGKPYVGELTFFDGAGFDVIEPRAWDERIGSWITLPKPTKSKE